MLNSVVGQALLNATLTVVKREVKCLKEVSQIQSVVSYLTNYLAVHFKVGHVKSPRLFHCRIQFTEEALSQPTRFPSISLNAFKKCYVNCSI